MNGRRVLILLAGLALALTGCGEKYPANVESNFLNACEMTGGTVARCGCALEAIERRIPIEQYQVDESSMMATKVMPPDIMAAVSSC